MVVANSSSPQYPGIVSWLHNNPHRLGLGQVSLRYAPLTTGAATAPLDISSVSSASQLLDLYAAALSSNFSLADPAHAPACDVSVRTAVHPDLDLVSFSVGTAGQCGTGLAARIAFGYGTMDDLPGAYDWSGPSESYHTTQLSLNASASPSASFFRTLDADGYEVHCRWQGAGAAPWSFVRVAAHAFDLVPPASAPGADPTLLELSCLFTPRNQTYPVAAWMPWMVQRAQAAASAAEAPWALPLYADTAAAAASGWSSFWEQGAFVDLASNAGGDPSALELERRVVLSLYVTRANSAQSVSPAETGLLCNSWAGKFHEEMRFWHLTHWALWGRSDLLHRSDGFLVDILPNSTSVAAFQGYDGARWPKMIAPLITGGAGSIDVKWPGRDFSPFPFSGGDDSAYGRMVVMDMGSSVGPLLLWEQPHPIWMADLQLRAANASGGPQAAQAVLDFQWPIVNASAAFLASYVYLNETAGQYYMGPPMYGGEESGNPTAIYNPSHELVATSLALDIANRWRTAVVGAPDPKWADVSARMAKPAVDRASSPSRPTYSFNYACACALHQPSCPKDRFNLTQCPEADSHPMLLGILGMMNGIAEGNKYGVDVETANNTVADSFPAWNMPGTWGWDFGGLWGLAQVRLGWSPESVVGTLVYNTTKNSFLRVGVNFQNQGLAAYLPGNGALLMAVAAMAGGAENGFGPQPMGFPAAWGAQAEGFVVAYP